MQRESKQAVRTRKEMQLFEVLNFMILPTRCYHEYLEEYFENPATYVTRGPCGNNCSYCTG